MKIKYTSYDGQGLRGGELDVTGVVTEDAHGNPIFVAIEEQPGVEVLMDYTDPDFHRSLSRLGLDRVVSSREVRDSPVPDGFVPLLSKMSGGESSAMQFQIGKPDRPSRSAEPAGTSVVVAMALMMNGSFGRWQPVMSACTEADLRAAMFNWLSSPPANYAGQIQVVSVPFVLPGKSDGV